MSPNKLFDYEVKVLNEDKTHKGTITADDLECASFILKEMYPLKDWYKIEPSWRKIEK